MSLGHLRVPGGSPPAHLHPTSCTACLVSPISQLQPVPSPQPPWTKWQPPCPPHPTSCSTHHPPRPDLPPPPHQACALLHPHPPRRRCVTQPGRRLLRLWFARPIINIGVINDRLDGVEFFLHRPDALDVLRAALRKVGWLL